MPTLDQISKELLEAMKQKDSVRTSTLRMLISSIRNHEIKKAKALTESDVLEVIQAEAKRRREAIDEYAKASRKDLADKEQAELGVLQAYLPKPLTEAELKALAEDAIRQVGAKTPQDMGKVMSALMPLLKGRADGRQAQSVVKQILGS